MYVNVFSEEQKITTRRQQQCILIKDRSLLTKPVSLTREQLNVAGNTGILAKQVPRVKNKGQEATLELYYIKETIKIKSPSLDAASVQLSGAGSAALLLY